MLYRNTQVVPDAPQTWAELQAAALATTQAGYEGILFNGGRDEATTFDMLAAAAAGTTAMFIGGNWMYGQLQNTLPAEEVSVLIKRFLASTSDQL